MEVVSKLWKNYERLCDEVQTDGYLIPTAFEWPRSCRYWLLRVVILRLQSNMMSYLSFDGCRYGLKSIKRGKEHLFIKKPWMFASNIPQLRNLFNLVCLRDHEHETCNGIDAVHSQYYTKLIARLTHLAFMRHFTYNKKKSLSSNQ